MTNTYSMNMAVKELRELEQRQSGLINGNFTAKANKYKVKVSDLRKAYKAWQIEDCIYNWVKDNFGEAEAEYPSWSISALAEHLSKEIK